MSFSEQRPPESVFDPVAPATDFDMFESHLQPILAKSALQRTRPLQLVKRQQIIQLQLAYVLSLRDVKEANKLHNLPT